MNKEKKKVYEVLYSEKNIVALAKFLAPKYHYIHWKWFDGIPDENRIISCLKGLVRDVKEHITTGGLYADRKDGKIYIGIEQQNMYKKLISCDEEWEDWCKNLEKPERKYRMIRLRDD
jgi:myo-inositol-hexaphosphate 3-phosphohydrolase